MPLSDDMSLELIGDCLLRVSGGDVRTLRSLSAHLRRQSVWIEVVDGLEDVVAQFDLLMLTPAEAIQKIRNTVLPDAADGFQNVERVALPVRFGGADGPDFEMVCAQLNLSADELVSRICGADLTVDIVGFTPGFAYISGLPDGMDVPRLAQPRQKVPAGSLGIAAGRCGTYALEGPGGWQLIGRVMTQLFEPELADPFLLKAGTRLRFEPA